MVHVNVFVHQISAERFWDIKKPIPPVRVSTNLNVVSVEKKGEDELEVPFIFTVSYTPAVAQISVKGKACIKGERTELDKIQEDYAEKLPPPPTVLQPISNVAFMESIIITRTLNVPPPVPLPRIPVADKRKPSELAYRA